MREEKIRILWRDSGREPQEKPDAAYSDGMHVRLPAGQTGCIVKLPYPAQRCGMFILTCNRCGASAAITTAGRPDDPRSFELRCKKDQE